MSNETKETRPAEHRYDDIVELDNSLPRWWLGILYATMAFALAYYVYYEFGEGPSIETEYAREHSRAEQALLRSAGVRKGIPEAALQEAVKDLALRNQGAGIFQARCVSCHGSHGQGGIGPNLADEYWLHGGRLDEIAKTIDNGVADKGMPPWGAMLKEDEIKSLVSFIRSLRGSHPADAKAPQGPLTKTED